MPLSSTTLAEPMPPFSAAAWAPVPAPTVPWRTRPGRRGRRWPARRTSASGRLANEPPAPRSNTTAAGTIGTTLPRLGADLEAAPALLEHGHHAAGGVEPVGAAAGEADGVDARRPCSPGRSRSVSRVPGPPPRTSTPPTVPDRRQDDGRAGQPAAAAALVVADGDAGDVGDVVARARR